MRSPFVVAELSASHCGEIDRAYKILDVAAKAGANGFKLQTWSEMAVAEYVIRSGPWSGKKLADLYRDAKTPWDWHQGLFDAAWTSGMIPFSTPFDEASVDFLEKLACPIYKIASFEITHLPLIRYVASTRKRIIISTGMASLPEIEAAFEAAYAGGANNITLLRCVSAYPATPSSFNLVTMGEMARRFGCKVGVSDHSEGSAIAVAAAAMGAAVIEKHLSIDLRGPDGGFAMQPIPFANMVKDVRAAAEAVGEIAYGASVAEGTSLQFRRSLWTTRDVMEGEVFTRANVGILRPGGGMKPNDIALVIGRRAMCEVPRGTQVTWDLVA